MDGEVAAARVLGVGLLATLVLAAGCLDDNEVPAGLYRTQHQGGPQVRFDLEERPFPDVPFPNDVATRLDPTSPTGLRVNVSALGASQAEERVRRYINRSTGFGLFSPITVSFTAPLDVENIIRRHHERVPDFSDDAVYLVNVDPKSPEYGKFELIDMGRGNYPLTLANPRGYFLLDPRSSGTNLLFETVAEAHGPDGTFDPLADTDDDGVVDVPNLRDPRANPRAPGQLVEFYEHETNTLVMRPVHPLAPGTTYAVVLTRALRGADGRAVDSPFEFNNHASQTRALEPLRDLLPARFPERFDASLADVRFAWTFTTHVPSEEMEAIRAGLYGSGPLAWLSEKFPARVHMVHNVRRQGVEGPMTFDLEALLPVLVPFAAQAAGPGSAAMIEQAFGDVDYLVSGTFLSPNFLADKSGLGDTGPEALMPGGNPADNDEAFWIDLARGEAHVGVSEIPFICTVPRELEGRKAPFPVVIYSHAISTTRLEIMLFAGQIAKFGLAMCTIDAMGHGVEVPEEFRSLVDRLTERQGMPNLAGLLAHHRARDLTNDGVPDTGGDYFTSDLLHSRDMIRQTAIDQMQLIRVLRSFDGVRRFPDALDEDDPFIAARRQLAAGWDQDGDGEPEIAGDFNGDGVVDFGGERDYVALGTSLGGLQTSVLAGIEPTIRAAISNAGGGGLSDIALRTTISNVRAGALLRMMGPLLVGRPYVDGNGTRTGRMRLEWILANADDEIMVHLADIDLPEDGSRIVLRNLTREANRYVPEDEQSSYAYVRNGAFRVAVATDGLGGPMRRAMLGFDSLVSLERDLMGCTGGAPCGDQQCGDNQYCAIDGTCQPLAFCIADFRPEHLATRLAGSGDTGSGDTGRDRDDDTGAGGPDLERELALRTADEPRLFGDPLVIEIYNPDNRLMETIDTFPQNVVFQNILYPEGAPLAALAEGWGLKRQTPRFRSFFGIAQTLLEVADPAVWAAHFFLRPLTYDYEAPAFRDGSKNFLTVGTLGDQVVPISTSIAIARASGVLDTLNADPRYGTTPNDFLIENWVYEGIAHLNRIPGYPNTLFDPDDLDRGRFRLPERPDDANVKPRAEKPLRATLATRTGISALRLPYIRTTGEHTFNAPGPTMAFDIHTFMTNQAGWYLVTAGRELSDDPCLEKLFMDDCPFFDHETFVRPEF